MNAPAPSITIVTGSPRDGTALMMQMLSAGGLEVRVDDAPPPGQPGPHGYYDYAPSLALDVDVQTSGWVADALGKAVKVMAYQIQYLSPAFEYRVVFVCRDVAEVLDSWESMGLVRGESADAAFEAELLQRPQMRVLFVRYRDLAADPAAQAARVVEFLGLPLDAAAMAAAAQPAP